MNERIGNAELVGTFKVESPEWFAARVAGLGGSEVAAVVGLSPWQSRFSLWHHKLGMVPPQGESPEMEWGKRLEGAVLRKWLDNHPTYAQPKANGTYRHVDRPWQVANPDLIVFESADCETSKPYELVEAKTALYPDNWGEPGTDQIPPYYLTQTRWYLDVFGFDTCHVAVLIGGHDYREYIVKANADDQAYLRTAARQFLDEVASRNRPDIDESMATYQVIRQLPDGVVDEAIEIPAELGNRYLDSLKAKKAATAAAQQAVSEVLDAIGDARYAEVAGERIATRAVKANGTTHSLRPAKDQPEWKAA